LPELESARIAASYGLPYVRAERCASADEAAAAAEQIGYPVVVKIDNVAHKARVGGVALGLADAAGVREAARRMGGRVIVAEQVLGGVELLIGVTRDPDFGATVSVGVGGGLAEALELITHSLAPLDADGARELVASLPVIERMLGGEVPNHLIEAIVAVSRLAAEHPEISEIDVNPLLVSPERAVALDCLIVLDNPEERAA
jgi:succinyl-CoA synthetase beta subunit